MSQETKAAEAELVAWMRSRGIELAEKKEDRENHRFSDSAARETLFLDRYEEIAKKVFTKMPVPGKLSRSDRKPKRIINLLLSDLHYGAALSADEVPLQYGPVEEARRTAAVVVQTADYKRQYRKDTVLHVNLLGDIIQNQLHDKRDGAPLATQACSAQYLLTQALTFLAREFPAGVKVSCNTGNHGRNTSRHAQRATNEKWDSIETIIYHGLKMAMRSFPNVTFSIPKTPYYTSDLFGKTAYFTHGDSVINPGYPNKAIHTENINKQINNLIVSKGAKIAVVAVGHVHIATTVHLSSGVTFISNGALIPSDAYAQSIGIHSTACGQWVWESVEGHPVGDERFVTVNSDTDKDAAFDKIVRPFHAF
jgi:hypothetical protein